MAQALLNNMCLKLRWGDALSLTFAAKTYTKIGVQEGRVHIACSFAAPLDLDCSDRVVLCFFSEGNCSRFLRIWIGSASSVKSSL